MDLTANAYKAYSPGSKPRAAASAAAARMLELTSVSNATLSFEAFVTDSSLLVLKRLAEVCQQLLIFRYEISIEGQLRAAKGGYFDFMRRFSVYHERAYPGGATALPLWR